MGYVPSQRQPPPPSRMVKYFTIGGGTSFTATGISSMATSPNEGDLPTTPARIVPLGTSQGQKGVTVPALALGQTFVATATIPLALISGYTENQPPIGPGPTPKGPVVSRLQDQLLFQASMTVGNAIAGLHLLRFTAVPQARGNDGIVYNAQAGSGNLPLGNPYTSFQVLCTAVLEAEQATSEGVVTLGTEGRLTRQAGGGAT